MIECSLVFVYGFFQQICGLCACIVYLLMSFLIKMGLSTYETLNQARLDCDGWLCSVLGEKSHRVREERGRASFLIMAEEGGRGVSVVFCNIEHKFNDTQTDRQTDRQTD